MSATTMNPDLAKERKGASFNTETVTNTLDGSRQKTQRRRHIEHIVRSDPNLRGPSHDFLSREEQILDATRRHVAVIQKIKELGLTDPEEITMATAYTIGQSPFSMSIVAFMPPIRLLGDEEQKAKWLPRAEAFELIGCYAQTELGHGSHVRGIETRADYDVKTKEFVLNTPTISSTKWWAGSLGLAATHALVMAQLYSNGKCHGLHPIIVPIRDVRTHKALPGVEAGDIGPKFGFGTIDNGYMRLSNVRVPRGNLLKKSGEVLDDGTYVKPRNVKLVYGGMLGIRANLPRAGAYSIARAVTIAIRYSCVRRQSELKPGAQEPQVLDFQTQQHKLFPLLAASYAFWFVAQWMLTLHDGVMKEMNQGDFARLPEDHVSAAGLKAVVNWKAHEAVENCRLSCGGHGYSLASGLPTLYAGQVANSTAEGETTILLLQTAKYLAKCMMDVQQGNKLDPSASYLAQKSFKPFVVSSAGVDLQTLLAAFHFRSLKTLEHVGGKVQKTMGSGGDMHDAFNQNAVLLVEAAKAHTEVLIMDAFVSKVESIVRSHPAEARILGYLCQIYGITEILQHSAIFLQHQYLNKQQTEQIQDNLFDLYEKVRPEALSLVDSFDFSDESLGGILGRYDGNVYENLYKWAKESPLNKEEVHESFHKYLKPLKQAKL